MAYQIIYWPGFTGRAEPAILLLEDAGQSYEIVEDVEGSLESLSQDKPVFACPVLIDDAVVLSQTSVIVEYLGRKHGYEVSPDHFFAASQLAYNAADIWGEVYEERIAGNTAFLQERFPRWLSVLENSFVSDDSAFFFSNDAPSYVDFLVLNAMTLADYCWGEPAATQIAQRTKLSAWLERMKRRPKLKAYFENPTSLPVGYEEVSAATL